MGHRPSVDVLLESAADTLDLNFLTVIMTGMGYDGKEGMERITEEMVEQSQLLNQQRLPSSMACRKQLIEAGLADEVVDLQDISESIMEIIKS